MTGFGGITAPLPSPPLPSVPSLGTGRTGTPADAGALAHSPLALPRRQTGTPH